MTTKIWQPCFDTDSCGGWHGRFVFCNPRLQVESESYDEAMCRLTVFLEGRMLNGRMAQWPHVFVANKGGLPFRGTGIRTRATSNNQRANNQTWNAGAEQPATDNTQATSHISCKHSTVNTPSKLYCYVRHGCQTPRAMCARWLQ